MMSMKCSDNILETKHNCFYQDETIKTKSDYRESIIVILSL